MEGKGDDYPEAAFYMQGTLEDAFEEGKRLAMQTTKKWLYWNQFNHIKLNSNKLLISIKYTVFLCKFYEL